MNKQDTELIEELKEFQLCEQKLQKKYESIKKKQEKAYDRHFEILNKIKLLDKLGLLESLKLNLNH
jgi:hypothetical protein